MRIHSEPAFNWWVPHTLRRGHHLLHLVKATFHKNSLKFGIIVPCTVKGALALDEANGNIFWWDTINKEMTNVKVAFKFLDKGDPPPVGFKQICCHIIFDIKMDLSRKALFIPPQGVIKIKYKSVQKVSYKCTQNTFNPLQTIS